MVYNWLKFELLFGFLNTFIFAGNPPGYVIFIKSRGELEIYKFFTEKFIMPLTVLMVDIMVFNVIWNRNRKSFCFAEGQKTEKKINSILFSCCSRSCGVLN